MYKYFIKSWKSFQRNTTILEVVKRSRIQETYLNTLKQFLARKYQTAKQVERREDLERIPLNWGKPTLLSLYIPFNIVLEVIGRIRQLNGIT